MQDQNIEKQDSKSYLGLIFLLYAVAAVVFYWNGLKSPWFNACAFDQMLAFPFAIKWKDLIHLFSSSYHNVVWENEYHPLVTFIYFLNARLGGDNVVATKILNLVFIFLCSLLVYVSGRHLIKHRLWAFVAGLLFLTHPINSEPISVPDMDTDLMMTFFILLAFLSYLKFRSTLRKRWLIATACGYILALFCKETAIVFPGIIFAYEILISERLKRTSWLKILLSKKYVLLGLVALGYLVLQFFVINAGQISTVLNYNLWRVLIEAGHNFLASLKYLVFPSFFVSPVSLTAIFTAGILFAIIFKVESRRLSWRWPTFCLLWILLGLLPVLGILPVQDLSKYLHDHGINGIWISRRYLFLSLAAFCWLLASFLRHLSRLSLMKFFSISLLVAIILNNVRICGLSVFSDEADADTVHARIISGDKLPDYSFRSILFSESILTSLGYFLQQKDKRLLDRAKEGMGRDFTPQQVEAIVSFFGDVSLQRKPNKLKVFFSVRDIKEPREFWDEFIRRQKEL
jgi:hypothetical protein